MGLQGEIWATGLYKQGDRRQKLWPWFFGIGTRMITEVLFRDYS